MGFFHFDLLKKSSKSKARLGVLQTSRGKIHTPAFMPVGTQATVKTMTPDEVAELGAEIFSPIHITFICDLARGLSARPGGYTIL